MAKRYKTYQFRISEERRAEDDMNFATADKMMDALEEICREGVRLNTEANNFP